MHSCFSAALEHEAVIPSYNGAVRRVPTSHGHASQLKRCPPLDQVDLAHRVLESLQPPQSNIHPRLASESVADNTPIVDFVIVATSGSCTFNPDSCLNEHRELASDYTTRKRFAFNLTASNALKQQTLIKR